jgi:hypothetical protein
MLTLLGQAASQLALSRLNGQDAGRQVDDYYRYQYPNSYDGRYSNYDAYLSDPNYYDPSRSNTSYQYVNSNIPGIDDLDYYGDWQNVAGYGNAWRPRVDSSWVPYQQGQWTNNYPYGPTWVSSESWGYTPYHYGRWANVGNQWYWVPDNANTTPQYAPALVAFVPLNDTNQIGWVPLGPGDSYAPRYYDENWQPRYLSQAQVSPARLLNLGIPGAVTVVPVDAFGRTIDPRSIRRIDQQSLASNRATLDPLTYAPLRNAVVNPAWGRRGRIDLPPGIARKLSDTPVYVGTDIRESRFRHDVAKSMGVQRVSDQARNQKFNVKDQREESRQADIGRKQEADQGRKQDLGRVSAEAAKENNKDAQRQTLQAEQQQRQVVQQQRKDARVQEQATRADQRNQQRAQQATQQQQRKDARVQAQTTRSQQRSQQRAQQPAQQPQQKAARQPAQQPAAQQPAQQPAQQKAQRKSEQKPQAQRVANPAKPANAEVKQPNKGAAKQDRQPKPPDKPGQGGGKAKKP